MTLAPKSLTVARPVRPLEDPSGRRLRWMRRVGRAIALLFLLWFIALALGALGVAPSGGWHFGRALGPQSAPPPLARAPAGHSASVLGRTVITIPAIFVVMTHGRSSTAPGHTKTKTTATRGNGHASGQAHPKTR